MYASRLWWMLRWLGHDAVAVLNGGWGNGAPKSDITAQRRDRAAADLCRTPRPEMLAHGNRRRRPRRDQADWRLLDARSPDRFRGENETLDPAAGHIPGAANYFFKTNLGADGTFKTPRRPAWAPDGRLGGASPAQTICYCGSGVTACQNLLALEHAGLGGAKLYVGSWSEWSSDPARPSDASRRSNCRPRSVIADADPAHLEIRPGRQRNRESPYSTLGNPGSGPPSTSVTTQQSASSGRAEHFASTRRRESE